MLIARRGLLVAGASAAMARPAWAQSLSQGAFTHGVASGDPLAEGVIIWTRFVGGDGRIAWEVAEDEAFNTVTARGEAQAGPASGCSQGARISIAFSPAPALPSPAARARRPRMRNR
jgi:alkaline phosphatase D